MAIKHIGFEAAAAKAAEGEGESLKAGRAMIAASAHKASAKAKRANPRLLKVSGVGKRANPKKYFGKSAGL